VAEIGLSPTSNGFSGSSNMFSSPMGTQYQHNSNAVDNRQTFLGLGQKGLGEVRIGRQYTPVHEAMCAQNAGGCNGIAGDMIYSGANSSSTRTPANGIGTAAQIRASNSITYRSDNIQGFQVTGLYSANNTFTDNSMTTTPAAAGSGAVNYRMSGGNIVYTGVKNLDVRFGSQITAYNRDNAAAATTANVLLGNQAFLATPATLAIARTKERDQYAGVSYDFGVAKLALQQVVLEVEQLNLLTIKKTSNQVAVTAPVSKALNAWASYGQGNYRSSTSARDDKFSGYQAGTRYMLSKRTSLYAIYGAARQDAVTAGTTEYKDTQYSIGAVHSF
jgi:predicted porin